MVEHAQVTRLFAATQEKFNFGNADVWTLFHSFAFDFSVWELWGALLHGGRLVIVPYNTSRSPDAFYQLLCQQQVTVLNQTPSAFRQLISAQTSSTERHALRCVVFGGEALDFHSLKPWIDRNSLAETQLINMYGITEITVHATFQDISQSDIETQPGSNIGKPLPDLRFYLLDAHLQPVPLGVSGEIYIGGAGVARGYLNRPELTAERFVANPFAQTQGELAGNTPAEPHSIGLYSHDRLYKTGDLGRWLPDGHIEYLGRNDFQVKIRGFRIELGEIEAQLLKCPGVQDAVVVAREDNPGDKRLAAYLIAQDGLELSAAELRSRLSGVLADYQLPSAYVTLASFPLTANGKLDRKALPAPDGAAVVSRGYEAPQGPTETAIAQIWQDLLKLEQVGRNDHFFELGGHSLLVVTLIERLRQQGLSANVRAVFATPILAEMAAALDGNQQPKPETIVPANLIPADCTAITPEMLPLVNLSQAEIDRIVKTVPRGAANIQDIYPLAPLQEGILFHHLLETRGDAYLLRSVLSFDSRSRLDNFLKALQQVIDRHDILRTAVCWERLPQAVQVVYREAQLPIEKMQLGAEENDASECHANKADIAFHAFLARTDPRHQRLDLQHAPLFKAYIAAIPSAESERQESGPWHLALLNHHLVCDHLTLELIIAEIQQIQQGQAAQLPASLPYRNFIAQAMAVPPAEHEAYFKAQLGDITEPTAPFGLIDVQGDGAQIAEASLALSAELAQRIRRVARQQGVSAAVLFHVAWAQVLSQCTGRNEIVFGTVLLGRLQGTAGAGRVLGMFINTLPVRISLVGRGVAEVVSATYRRLSNLLDHEQASLTLAQRCSGVASSMPLFTTLFNYRHSDAVASQDNNLSDIHSWEGIQVLSAEERTNYPITVSIDDMESSFSITAQCSQGIDPVRIAGYLNAAIEGLVEALQETPNRLINTLGILPATERRQLLTGFNATAQAYPQDQLIQQLFERQAEQTPEATAVLFEGQSLSYRQLNARANRLAHHLIRLGIQADDRVAICVERSLEMVIGLLAILKAGGAYVPLDPGYPAERLAYMLSDSAPVAVLTQAGLQERLSGLNPAAPVVILDAESQTPGQHETAYVTESSFTQYPEYNPDPHALGLSSRHLAYVIYTSGSTGQPKGVMNEHGGVVNRLLWAQDEYRLNHGDRILQKTPFSFDVSVWEFFLPLLAGAQLVVARPEGHQDPHYLAALIESAGITTLHFVPSMLQVFLDNVDITRCRTIHRLLCSGEALSYALQSRFLEQMPAIELHNLYGPTEAAIDVTSWRCHLDKYPGIVPIGRPIANTQIYILDNHLQPVPLGVSGEIYIGGAGVARGYLNRPELTAERFVANPFAQTQGELAGNTPAEPHSIGLHSHDRLYKTGDLGRWLPDGHIEYLGRNDFQVKIRGFRIELGEIEAQLLKCPGVQDAVVVAREDNPGDKRLAAYLIAQDGLELSAAELRSRLSGVLADYQLPSAYVTLPSFPLTANGKLDRKALPAPDGAAVVSRGYEAPQGIMEETIARIWQELLKLEQVSRHDHFFELGGHSLLAVQLVSRLRQAFNVEIPLRDLFAQPVLADLAGILQGGQQAPLPPIEPADRHQTIPLSWAQQRLWFLDQLDPAAGIAYHMPTGLRLHGILDRMALKAALDRIVARHEDLRTRFITVDGQPAQVIDPADTGFALKEQDLRTLPQSEQSTTVSEITNKEVSQAFDLAAGPLIRGQLLQLAADEHLLLITQHHIISDGWSFGLLVHEFSRLYTAFSQGRADPLPALTLQYADYAAWQRQWLQGERLQAQAEFWKTQLSGAPALLELPTDRPRPLVQSYAGGSIGFELSEELSAGLKQLGQRHGCTLFMVLLSGWSILLSRLSGQDDVVIGAPAANRQRAEIEALIGFFVNTLALRVQTGGNPRVVELLTRIKSLTLNAYAHQDIPFEQVVDIVKPERSLGHSPLFQAMIAMNNTPSVGELTLPGLTLSGMELQHGTTQFDLSLSLTDTGENIIGGLEYATELFDRASIERIIGHYQTLLTGIVADEQQRIGQLPLLSQAEYQQLISGFNATAQAYPQDQLIHQLFERQAERTPEATAVVYEGQSLSYRQLNARANRLAHHLIRLGIQADDRVAICVERSLEMVIGLLAILKAGGAYVPLDPGYPAERLAYMLSDSAPVAVLTQAGLQERLSGLNPAAPVVILDAESQTPGQHETAYVTESSFTQYPEHNPDPRALGLSSRHLAYVIYTSG